MKYVLGLILISFATVGCADKPVGTKQRPFAVYFVPSVDAQEISTQSVAFEKFLQKHVSQKLYGQDTGFYVTTAVPASYVAVVEAFGTDKADFAFFTTFAYVLTKDMKGFPIRPLFTVARGPNGEEHTYKGQIITRADSGINSIADLKGKKFAYTDPASTSGYIMPSNIFKKQGIELGEFVFAKKHDNVVTMILQRQVDAGATYYSPPEAVKQPDGSVKNEIRDARMRVLTQYPNVEKDVKIIGFSDEVPNEPWVIRTNLYEDAAKTAEVTEAVKQAVIDFIKTPAGKEVLWQVSTGTGLVESSDETYAEVREMILASDIDVAAKVK